MTPTPKSASGATARQTTEAPKPQGAAGPFVINLCSSTTPMALSNPEQPELKRFSFFVSRRFEEGRERFRMHMGYFDTLHEAEEWLSAVRDIYPGAWAGEAPGKKLRERAVAAAAAQAQHAAGPPPHLNVPTVHAATQPAVANTPVRVSSDAAVVEPAPELARSAAAVTQRAAAVAPAKVSVTVNATPAAKSGTTTSKGAPVAATQRSNAPAQPRLGATLTAVPTGRPAPGAARPAVTSPSAAGTNSPAVKAALPAKSAARPTAVQQALQAAAAQPQTVPVGHPQQAAPAARPSGAPGSRPLDGSAGRTQAANAVRSQGGPTGRPASKASAKPALPNSNVREVLKALGETPADNELTGETRMMPAPQLANLGSNSAESSFSDTQVLNFLETRRADGTEISGVDVETGAISLLKPDDTGTRRALKEAIVGNAPVAFAVQLQWSVQPVELSKVPPLAIFSAYTLYTVEGSRDGRKWYGLRLGFFSDAISAKQVAYYVRSEFNSVAVVPVSPQERTRASDGDKKAELAFPRKSRSGPVDEFKLIDSDEAPASPPVASRQAPTKAAGPAKAVPPAAANRRTGARANGRVRANERRGPQTLEETLEILGAGELEMDNGTGQGLNDTGVRHLRVEVQKDTPFGRLLERLSERVRKP